MPLRSAFSLADFNAFATGLRGPDTATALDIASLPDFRGFGSGANALAFPHTPPPQPTTGAAGSAHSADVPAPVFSVNASEVGLDLHESVHVIQYTGVSSNRVDIVFLGDGYTAGQLDTVYMNHVMGYLNYMFADTPLTDPFSLYQNFFNIYVVDVTSAQSGADDPTEAFFVDTALDASYLWDGVTQRLLYINHGDAVAVLNTVLAGSDIGQEMLFVTVNSTQYGGGGGYFAVYAGGNSSAYEVALHELGHSFAGLADEYGGEGAYAGGEPGEPNVTISPTGADWSEWLGYNDPILGVVGAFEGGFYHDQGVWRPTFNSRMRSLDRPFDAIAREAFILQFYSYVDPLDGWDNNVGAQTNLLELNVDTLDPVLIHVDWTVNGVLFADVGEEFDLSQDFGWGTYTITARAYDPTPWVRGDRSSLEQSATWTVVNDYRLVGTAASESLTGNNNAQTIVGFGGADTIDGVGGADRLDGGTGNDALNGGAGVDVSVYSLASTGATWARNINGSWTVNAGANGVDMLTNVEFLDFSDRDVFLDRAARTFSGNGTSDILFRRSDGIMASWEVTGTSISAASFLPTAGAGWTPLGTGDFNGDGRDDVLWQRSDGLVYTWHMNGGTVQSANAITGIGAEWNFLGVGDFNGDLKDDIAWRRSDGIVVIWQMNGAAIASANAVTGLPAAWQIAGFGDFNSDGHDDFLWRNSSTGQSVIWHMNGSAIQGTGPTSVQAGLDWSVVGVGDTNGDGRDDIILQRASDGMISVWAMDGTTAVAADVGAANPAHWTVRGIGDYNGDGRDDILWQHDNGLVYVWLMNGAAIAGSGALSGIGSEWGII